MRLHALSHAKHLHLCLVFRIRHNEPAWRLQLSHAPRDDGIWGSSERKGGAASRAKDARSLPRRLAKSQEDLAGSHSHSFAKVFWWLFLHDKWVTDNLLRMYAISSGSTCVGRQWFQPLSCFLPKEHHALDDLTTTSSSFDGSMIASFHDDLEAEEAAVLAERAQCDI